MVATVNYPSVKPTLMLDFANSQMLDPRITFTRASTATYYDGKTYAKAEENLVTYSQAMATANWNIARATVTNNSGVAPDGTTTAIIFTQSAGQTTAGYVQQSKAIPANSTYSVYAKAVEKTFVVIMTNSTSAHRTWFNLSTGTVGTTNANHIASIVNAGNGWYRCIVTSTAVGETLALYLADTNGSVAVTDSGSILLWGAQLEQRSAVTAYTPTTTQTITNYIPQLMTAAANVPRFDFNPITEDCNGLLIEEERTNLVLQSADFTTSWTTANSTVTPNVNVSPGGSISADQLAATAAGVSYITQTVASISSGSVSCSIYCKSPNMASTKGIALRIRNTAGTSDVRVNFNLNNGTAGTPAILSTDFSGASATLTSVGNGWYRATLSASLAVTLTNARLEIYYAGYFLASTTDGTVYIWGAQLENAAFPTSYTPTTTASAQRNADTAVMTGTNFSNWYNQSEGTLVVEAMTPVASQSFARVAHISDSVSPYTDRLSIQRNGTDTRGLSAPDVSLTNTAAFPAGVVCKIGFAAKSNDFALCTSGGTVSTSTSGTLYPASALVIGSTLPSNTSVLNGYIRRILYYQVRLSNTEIQSLTI